MSETTPMTSLKITENAPLAALTTFKVGGPARFYAEAHSSDELRVALAFAKERELPFVAIGGGANLLVADRGYRGLVLRVVNDTFVVEGTRVIAGAGLPIGRFLHELAKRDLGGLEYLVGVPGTVGGAIVGNAGTANEWIGNRVESVTVFNAETRAASTLPRAQCDFRYRWSRFKEYREEIVLRASFSLVRRPTGAIRSAMASYLARRRHQPAGDACAGCIFVNPPGESAGRLIERAGLKGKQIGGARVSETHANFIVNTSNATSEHIAELISYVKQQVRDRLGVQLHEEIRYIGFN